MVDVEAVIINTLKPYFSTYSDVPADTNETDEFVTVERTNGGIENGVGTATCAIQCWSSSRAKANDLALNVSEKLNELHKSDSICKVTIDSLYNFPDITGRHARYQIVVILKTNEGLVI